MIRFENQNKTEKKIQNEYRFNSFAFITRSLNTTTIFGLEFFFIWRHSVRAGFLYTLFYEPRTRRCTYSKRKAISFIFIRILDLCVPNGMTIFTAYALLIRVCIFNISVEMCGAFDLIAFRPRFLPVCH